MDLANAISLVPVGEPNAKERNQNRQKMTNKISSSPSAIEAAFREKGWSYLAAGKALGVDFGHLRRVIRGERQSARLLSRIHALPVRKPAATLPRLSSKS